MHTPEAGSVWQGAAQAKTNLFLRVLAREVSGYHQIESLFQRLSLADEVTLELRPAESGITLSVSGIPDGALGPHADNLMVRAATRYLAAAAAKAGAWGLHMTLGKVIPHGAGLGGGSSDAATVLRGLGDLLGHPVPPSETLSIGASIGSDIPFFLSGGALALVWGRGGRLLPLPPLPSCPVAIVQPERRISTPEAYARLATLRQQLGIEEAGPRLMVGWTSWDAVSEDAENAFEAALTPVFPELPVIHEFLARAGAAWSLMSGSGSAVVGFFPAGIPSLWPWELWDAAFPETPRPSIHEAVTMEAMPGEHHRG
jgi:4-diphosphocytidyl-2-C-methyl-D-erythritol kinase